MITPVSSLPPTASDLHCNLTDAHSHAASLAQALNEELVRTYEINLVKARKIAIQIGHALHKVSRSEQACGTCSGKDHQFTPVYQEMLCQHHLAYADFERLSSELEKELPPRASEIAALAADIKFHLHKAEAAHQKIQTKTAA